jgi:uncharacterized protein YndB with AHSA1/START domain
MNDYLLLVIRKILLVRAPVALAFDYFTSDISDWWPSMSTDSGICTLERGVGGRIYEVRADDRIDLWGSITEWRPPHHLQFSWTRDNIDTTVQIEFLSNGSDRTRVEFSHKAWKPHQFKQYVEYRNYWDSVLVNGYQDYVRRRRCG